MPPAGYCLLDTNIWIANPLLNSPVAAALVFTLKRLRHSIALPEVVEEEIVKTMVAEARQHAERIKGDFDWFAVVMGVRDDYRIPSADEVEERTRRRLDELGTQITRVPLTLDLTRRALHFVYRGLPPNSPNSEQFRDSTIWQTVLDLARSAPVVFISNDRAFFENRDVKQGLAASLRKDLAPSPHPVTIYPELKTYLSTVAPYASPFDRAAVANAITLAIAEELRAHAAEKGLQLGEMREHDISSFITENPSLVAVEFQVTYWVTGEDADDAGWTPGRLVVSGTCALETTTGSLSEVRVSRIEVLTGDGRLIAQLKNVVYASGVIHLGRGTVPYRFRYPL